MILFTTNRTIRIIFIVPFGYVVRFSQGLGLPWLSDLLGSVADEIFWILLVAFLYPKIAPLGIAMAAATPCGVSQYFWLLAG